MVLASKIFNVFLFASGVLHPAWATFHLEDSCLPGDGSLPEKSFDRIMGKVDPEVKACFYGCTLPPYVTEMTLHIAPMACARRTSLCCTDTFTSGAYPVSCGAVAGHMGRTEETGLQGTRWPASHASCCQMTVDKTLVEVTSQWPPSCDVSPKWHLPFTHPVGCANVQSSHLTRWLLVVFSFLGLL